MNYFSHYFLDKDSTDSLFFVGVSTPDLISTFNRSQRLRASRMPILIKNEVSDAEISFYHGVMRHFEVDRIFHSSDFFRRETVLIRRTLQEAFGSEIHRAFFVSHILLELILDRILINQHSSLLYSFYKHFEAKDVQELVALTEWVACQPLPGYDAFLKRFAEKKFLYNYSEWDFLIEVTRYIMHKVSIENTDYLFTDKFLAMMHSYEEGLRRRVPRALKGLEAMLSEKAFYSTE